MKVYARHRLVGGELRADEPALLLEGSWPSGESPLRRSLDDVIDGRHAWIDEEASRLADQLAQAELEQIRERGPPPIADPSTPRTSRSPACPGPAYLNELKLRYYLVKLLRVVAFFEEAKSDDGAIELIVARRRDEDYADVFASMATAHDWRLGVTWHEADSRRPVCAPPNAWWRRAAAAVNTRTNPSFQGKCAPRVVLCGNRRVLDGVCGELARRGAAVTWLYARFAARTWLRWRARGVGQLVCSGGADLQVARRSKNRHTPPPRLSSRGIDLGSAVARWFALTDDQQGERHSRLWQRIDEHFARLRPTLLVLDEDATPLARAAVAVARRHGVPSVVIQHGVPRVKFGFAPLAADYLFAWGASSRRQFMRWGVPLERVRVTGWPGGRTDCRSVRPKPQRDVTASRPAILLFATTPPSDDRPDAVTFHLTDRTHRQMLRIACAAVADVPGARLTIKLHPRCREAGVFRQAAAEFPRLRCRIVRRGDIWRLVGQAACVLNCTSSAGIEAGSLGVSVIELIPAGSLDLLPASQWGALGTARTEAELRRLLGKALDQGALHAAPSNGAPSHDAPSNDARLSEATARGERQHVLAALGSEAARRVVDELLTIEPLAAPPRGELPTSMVYADTAP